MTGLEIITRVRKCSLECRVMENQVAKGSRGYLGLLVEERRRGLDLGRSKAVGGFSRTVQWLRSWRSKVLLKKWPAMSVKKLVERWLGQGRGGGKERKERKNVML